MTELSIERGPGLWLAMVVALACVGWAWIPLTISVPNERTRAYLTMALVERGEIRVDREVERFGRVIDLAKHEGHYYTDKAPGSSFLGALVYAPARALSGGAAWTSDEVLTLMRRGLMLPIALLGLVALYRVLVLLGVSLESAALAALAWPLATTALHYAGSFLGHHLVAVALVTSTWLALAGRSVDGGAAWARLLGAGLVAGLAGFIEYQAGPACAVLGLFVVYGERKRPLCIAAFALGVAPCLAALLAYNDAAFGSPFALSYTHVATAGFASNHDHGIGGIDLPKAKAIAGLLFSPHRGLLVTIPLTWLAIAGSYSLIRKQRALGVAIAIMVSAQVLVISGFDGWWGGWSYGPRLLLPVLGMALVPAAFALDALRARPWGVALVAALLLTGLVQSGLMHATFFESPEELENPIYDVALPVLERGSCAPSAGQALGLSRCGSFVPFAALALGALVLAWLAWSRAVAARARLAAAVAAIALALVVLAATRAVHRSPQRELENTMRFIAKHQPPDA